VLILQDCVYKFVCLYYTSTMKKALVTGANGFVGSHLIKTLSDYSIVGIVKEGNPESLENVQYVSGDITDQENVISILSEHKPELIFHLAGIAPTWVKDAQLLFDVNFFGTLNIYQAVVKLKEQDPGYNPKILYVSSSDVYGNSESKITEDAPLQPLNLYATSKVAADRLSYQYATCNGLKIVIVRPFPHIGPRQAPGFFIPDMMIQIEKIKKGEQQELMVGNLEAIRDYTDVRDVVRAYKMLLESDFNPGDVFNVCSGEGIKIKDLLDKLLSHIGQPITVKTDSERLRTSEASVRVGDNTKLIQKTGWKPENTLDQTLMDIISAP
jgi:GDP-4-dehydro-6-deoxy-D-mannose reductase